MQYSHHQMRDLSKLFRLLMLEELARLTTRVGCNSSAPMHIGARQGHELFNSRATFFRGLPWLRDSQKSVEFSYFKRQAKPIAPSLCLR
jgi:hypothetical protein